jgi:hypothetical protein
VPRPAAFVSASTDLLAVLADLQTMVPRYASLSVPVSVLYGTHDGLLLPKMHGE